MIHPLTSLLLICGIWFTHYKMPKSINDNPYNVVGLVDAHYENGTVISRTTNIFNNLPEFFNITNYLNNNNDTYYILYSVAKCHFNDNYSRKINNIVMINTCAIWIINIILLFLLGYELSKKNYTNEYKVFICIWQIIIFGFLLCLILFDVYSLTNFKSQEKYIGHTEYNMKGVLKTNRTSYENYKFGNQYELLEKLCGLFSYGEVEHIWAKFSIEQQIDDINSYQRIDLTIMIIFTCFAFGASCIGIAMNYGMCACDENVKIKEEYGEL
jgi:hypothetical protein